MKKIYQISLELGKKTGKNSFCSANAVYVILRTLIVFVPSLITGLLLKNIVHLPSSGPEVFVIIFCGWITVIFGFWGALLYLMRIN